MPYGWLTTIVNALTPIFNAEHGVQNNVIWTNPRVNLRADILLCSFLKQNTKRAQLGAGVP